MVALLGGMVIGILIFAGGVVIGVSLGAGSSFFGYAKDRIREEVRREIEAEQAAAEPA